jgi:hypothetical protein
MKYLYIRKSDYSFFGADDDAAALSQVLNLAIEMEQDQANLALKMEQDQANRNPVPSTLNAQSGENFNFQMNAYFDKISLINVLLYLTIEYLRIVVEV